MTPTASDFSEADLFSDFSGEKDDVSDAGSVVPGGLGRFICRYKHKILLLLPSVLSELPMLQKAKDFQTNVVMDEFSSTSFPKHDKVRYSVSLCFKSVFFKLLGFWKVSAQIPEQ